MKKPILLSVILVMTALGDTMQAEVDMVGVFMDAIAEVESGGRDIGRHADGISVGKYGVTAFAVAELRRVGVLPPVPVIDLFNPHDNALVAREYLLLMLKRKVLLGVGAWGVSWRSERKIICDQVFQCHGAAEKGAAVDGQCSARGFRQKMCTSC